jgi:hypothetical protein
MQSYYNILYWLHTIYINLCTKHMLFVAVAVAGVCCIAAFGDIEICEGDFESRLVNDECQVFSCEVRGNLYWWKHDTSHKPIVQFKLYNKKHVMILSILLRFFHPLYYDYNIHSSIKVTASRYIHAQYCCPFAIFYTHFPSRAVQICWFCGSW